MTPGYYSPHFSKRELWVSEYAARKGIDNTPTPEADLELYRLCHDVLEPLRAQFGIWVVSSGYRCPEVNAAIGGSYTSAHPHGRAADGKPASAEVTLRQVMDWLISSDLPVDQAIYEYGRWIHVGIAAPGQKPRRQFLMVFAGSGYQPFDVTDSRVTA